MVFNSIHFLVFFPVVCVVYFLVPGKLKNLWLLLSSYFFYMCWDIRYVFILIGITLITYYSGLVLEATDTPAYRRLNRGTLVCCIVLCISVLFFFKYANFTLRTAITVLEAVKISHSLSVMSIILPVGISFYVFQAVGYVIDVYKKDVVAEHNIINYALFV